jgi:hypothetical protein
MNPTGSLFPPFPRTKSVLPLGNGNKWVYSATAYDSAGNKIDPSRAELHLAITGVFGLDRNNTLIKLDRSTRDSTFPCYAYKYEWENADSGLLVVYRDYYPLELRGLYVVGDYVGDSTRIYAKEKLLLSYPAADGRTWVVAPDSADSTSLPDSFETVTTTAQFFVPDAGSMTAVTSYTCLLYKETLGPTVCYYYYYPDIGCVGTLRYKNGVLRQSTILKNFAPGDN